MNNNNFVDKIKALDYLLFLLIGNESSTEIHDMEFVSTYLQLSISFFFYTFQLEYLGSLKGHIIFQKIHVRLQPGIRLHGIFLKNVREMKN